jgi:hypothetical protein
MPSCSLEFRRGLAHQAMVWSVDLAMAHPISVRNWDILHYSS